MSEQEYIQACQMAFGSDRYGWSEWEQETAIDAYADGLSVQAAVGRMNAAYARRRANRSA